MEISIKLVGLLRTISKRSKLTLEIRSGTTLRDVAEILAKSEPTLKQAIIDPEVDDLHTNLLILVNGKEISVLQGLETLLKDKDELTLIPVVHGG